MNTEGIITIIGAVTVSITTIVTLVFTLVANAKLKAAEIVREGQNKKLDEIHVQTNSNLDKLQTKLDIAMTEITHLKDRIMESKK